MPNSLIGRSNGLDDGPFVNLGGKSLSAPFWKNFSRTNEWVDIDSGREPLNYLDTALFPNDFSGETSATAYRRQFTAQGIKVNNGGNPINDSSGFIVGLAILESTKYSNAY